MTVATSLASERAAGSVGAPVVGKDVLELLSTAMYVEPLTIYREYLQNAADAIDDARCAGRSAGRIDISIDPSARSISIRDDGMGIPSDQFIAVITAIGASRKRGTSARGFRGVGRLSGLGCARSVVFRTRASGEDVVSRIVWDCQALRGALKDPGNDGDLAALVETITTVSREVEAGEPFFEVRLEGVARHGDDRLMAPLAVRDYVSQVAPLPFRQDFSLAETIRDALAGSSSTGDLEVSINGSEPLTRPFLDSIEVTGGRTLRLREVEVIEVPGYDGGIAAVGWVAHHDYDGAIHPSTLVRGLRVRVGDIQIGDGGILADIFPEQRFDAWTIGELHVLDDRIVPNGRRDDFERNVHLSNMKNQLAPIGRDVARRCRTSSQLRKRMRDIDREFTSAAEGIAILEQGSLGPAEMQRVGLGVDLALARAEKLITGGDLVDEVRDSGLLRLSELRATLDDADGGGGNARSPLDRLPDDRRLFFEEAFSLIYRHAPNRASAKALVDRILGDLD